MAATAFAAVSLALLAGVPRVNGAQPSLPSALASFLTEEAHATPSEREALLAGTPLELRIVLPDPARGPGFWLVTINRSRSDGLSGFTGRVIRSRVRSEVEDGTRAALTATKTKLESKEARP